MMHVFEKVNLGKIELKNHFVRSSTWENMTTEDGHMTESLYDIYETIAKNEVGLILTGYANILKEEQPNPGMMGMYDDSFVDEYQRLTNLVHQYGAKIIMQLAYGGTKTTYKVGDRIIYAPSAVAELGTGTLGTEMTKQDIIRVEDAFAQAALRVKKSGFDGVEIHGAHTYLINQFLSPYYNRREDEYGKSLENRMRFLVEICEKTRALVGDEFTIGVKLTVSEFFEGGLTFDECRQICRKMQEIGIDFIELSGNIHGKAQKMVGESFDGFTLQSEGYFIEYAKVVSEEVSIPIITVGGFKDVQNIENILNTTKIPLFGLSRPLMAEPDLVKRWKEGETSPAKCVRCSKCRTKEGNYCVVFNRNNMIK